MKGFSSPSSPRRSRRGFTLVELMISLVMGLIVSLAAIALARTATTSFHEQARASITEMSVRTGSERLRQDLMRVSYMTTGNIVWDPKVVRLAGGTPQSRTRGIAEFANLQGLHIIVGGSKGLDGANNLAGTNNVSANNFVDPDAIVITGNMTTDDMYAGTIVTAAVCGSGFGQTVRLDPAADAAVYALVGNDAGVSTQKNVEAAFTPVITGPGAPRFIAQVVDALGCVHYAPVCAVNVDPANIVTISLQAINGGRSVYLSHSNTGDQEHSGLEGSCGASDNGPVTISPVHRVRWQIKTATGTLTADPNLEAPNHKFDLVRQLLDFENLPAGPAETVAEYAVDLKFGITSITGGPNSLLLPNTVPTQVVNDMDTDPGGGAGPIDVATRDSLTTTQTQVGPQHVRSVRFRLATRGSMTDREADVVLGAPRTALNPYMSRYCMENTAPTTCKKFARVRTVVSEVTLQNQARMFYP